MSKTNKKMLIAAAGLVAALMMFYGQAVAGNLGCTATVTAGGAASCTLSSGVSWDFAVMSGNTIYPGNPTGAVTLATPGTQTITANFDYYACPSGYSRSGNSCIQTPSCAAGSYNSATDRCELAANTTYSCPSNGATGSTLSACNSACTQTTALVPVTRQTGTNYCRSGSNTWYAAGGFSGPSVAGCTTDSGISNTGSLSCPGGYYDVCPGGVSLSHYAWYGEWTFEPMQSMWMASARYEIYSYPVYTTTYSCPYTGVESGSPGSCSTSASCTGPAYSCSTGSLSGSICYLGASCSAGGSLVGANDRCEAASTATVVDTASTTVEVIPATLLSSVGCPANATKSVAFNCSPTYYVGGSGAYKSATVTWTGADLTASGNSLTITAPGSKTATARITYFGGATVQLSQTINVIDPSFVTLNSLGCATTAIVGVPLTCTPSVSTNVGDIVYTWSAPGLTASGNTLTFTTTGVKTVTLTASSASSGKSSTLTQTITANAPVATITSLGCPIDALTGKAISCNPSYSANVGSGVVYTWSGDGLTASGNSLTFSTPGEKTITLTATYPNVGTIGASTQSVTVVTPIATITSLGCVASATVGVPFTCNPTYSVNVAGSVTNTWSGNNLTVNGDTLTFTTVGEKTVTLTVNYPDMGIIGTATQTITALAPVATITSLGCPATVLPGKAFTCNPSYSANVGSDVTYAWTGDGLTANGNSLTISGAGLKTITLTATYPNVGVIGVATQNVTLVTPSVLITSPGCPSDALAMKGFTCVPAVTTNFPAEYQNGATYTWSGTGLTISGDTLSFNTTGTKTLQLTVTYPLAEVSASATQSVTVVLPAVTVQSLGCPNDPVAFNDFTCTPVVTTNIPASFQEGATYTWSGTASLQVNGDVLNFNAVGQKIITLTVNYPLAGVTGAKTQAVNVHNPDATVSSLGCPTTVITGKAFRCTPSISSGLPADLREGAVYTWAGDNLQINEDGSLAFSAGGMNSLTLTVSYPLFQGVTGTKTQTLSSITPSATITSLGCPATELTTRTFTCNPHVTTNLPAEYMEGAVYTWTGNGLLVNNNALNFAAAGSKALTLSINYPLAEATAELTGNVNIIQPQVAMESLGCPTDVLTNKPFTCNPSFMANIPISFKTGVTYAWTGEGLLVNGNQLTFTTDGAKTIGFTVTYPMADTSGSITQAMTSTTATATITSLGCPVEIVTNEVFSCNPVFTTNLPASLQNGATYTWSGNGLTVNQNKTMLFTQMGSPKDISLTINYPTADFHISATQQMTVGALNVAINSLGCPANVNSQDLFTCQPTITTDLPDSYLDRLEYYWSGNGLAIDAEGSMALSGSGNMDMTITIGIRDTALTFQKTESINVNPGDLQIASVGCPADVFSKIPFNCTPSLSSASAIPEGLQYTWSGDDLQTKQNGKLEYPTAGDSKPIVLSVLNPASGQKLLFGSNMKVTAPVVDITSLLCPTSVRKRKQFTCTQTVETNLPDEIVSGFVYEWAGDGLEITTDGPFMFSESGSNAVVLSISHPEHIAIGTTKAAAMTVTEPTVKIKGLGCPSHVTEYTSFACIPSIYLDKDTTESEVAFKWKINDEEISDARKLSTAIQKNGTVSISLTAAIMDPAADTALGTDTKSVSQTVLVNTSDLRLRATIPRRVLQGGQVTLAADTSFSMPEMVVYTWTVDEQVYEGKTVTINVPSDKATPIAYSLTAKTTCCEGIAPETITGEIPVTVYTFPAVIFAGPRDRATNIAPFNAYFRLAVRNSLNTPLTYTWDFGDGTVLPETTDITRSVMHTYQEAGTYPAKLTVKDNRGNVNEYISNVLVTIAPPRQIAISKYLSNATARAPLDVYFRYKVSEGLSQDVPVKNVWMVDGVAMSEKSIVTFNFANPGTYNVALDVLTKYGNTMNASVPITVNENVPPTCTINQKLIKAGKYQLDAQCYDTDGRIVSYRWDFGDGSVATAARAYKEYGTGTHSITLTATDDSGGEATAETTITVN